MTDRKLRLINPKGVSLPPGNPTLTLVRKVDPETLAKRLREIYKVLVTKGASKSALLSTLADNNRHKRWSVRILLKMKLLEAIPEAESKEKKAIAKKAVAKATRKKAPAKPTEQKPEPKPQVA